MSPGQGLVTVPAAVVLTGAAPRFTIAHQFRALGAASGSSASHSAGRADEHLPPARGPGGLRGRRTPGPESPERDRRRDAARGRPRGCWRHRVGARGQAPRGGPCSGPSSACSACRPPARRRGRAAWVGFHRVRTSVHDRLRVGASCPTAAPAAPRRAAVPLASSGDDRVEGLLQGAGLRGLARRLLLRLDHLGADLLECLAAQPSRTFGNQSCSSSSMWWRTFSISTVVLAVNRSSDGFIAYSSKTRTSATWCSS